MALLDIFSQRPISPLPERETQQLKNEALLNKARDFAKNLINKTLPSKTITIEADKNKLPQRTAKVEPSRVRTSITQPREKIKFPSVSGIVDNLNVPEPPTNIRNSIAQIFPREEWANAARIAFFESSNNPKAINDKNTNGTRDFGLFQINEIHIPDLIRVGLVNPDYDQAIQDLLDPITNAKVARYLFDRSGWQPWVAAGREGVIR